MFSIFPATNMYLTMTLVECIVTFLAVTVTTTTGRTAPLGTAQKLDADKFRLPVLANASQSTRSLRGSLLSQVCGGTNTKSADTVNVQETLAKLQNSTDNRIGIHICSVFNTPLASSVNQMDFPIKDPVSQGLEPTEPLSSLKTGSGVFLVVAPYKTECSSFCPPVHLLSQVLKLPGTVSSIDASSSIDRQSRHVKSAADCCRLLDSEDVSSCLYQVTWTADSRCIITACSPIKSLTEGKSRLCWPPKAGGQSSTRSRPSLTPDSSPTKLKRAKLNRSVRASQVSNDFREKSTQGPVPLPPRNLQITPLRFGTINVSWTPVAPNQPFLDHYELVFISLNNLSNAGHRSECNRLLSNYRPRQHFHEQEQFSINITAPATFTHVEGLPPDQFYRVLLFAVSHTGQAGPPASMPSSPRVPTVPPETAPRQVRITEVGTHQVSLTWLPPEDAGCTGELINYVIRLNSSRLIEPLVLKVASQVKVQHIPDLIPGTYYTVTVAAATRGGVGRESDPVQFKTAGELPQLVLDEQEEEDLEDQEIMARLSRVGGGGSRPQTQNRRKGEVSSGRLTGNPSQYLVLPQIYNLRAAPGERFVQLVWSLAPRSVQVAGQGDLEQSATTDLTSGRDYNTALGQGTLHFSLPSDSQFVIRWGDVFPGPFEDSIPGNQTQYRIENLNPGTTYYIRVLAVTRFGEGAAAYTVAKTKEVHQGVSGRGSISSDSNHGEDTHLIPINLVVQAVGSSWSRIGWELPPPPGRQAFRAQQSLTFQIRHYTTDSGESLYLTSSPGRTWSTDTVPSQTVTNVTLPLQMGQAGRLGQFKAMLRGLRPATRYEFSVRLISTDGIFGSQGTQLQWSMVQGFETYGQEPLESPRNIRILMLSPLKPSSDKPNIPKLHFSSSSAPTATASQLHHFVDGSVSVGLRWDPVRQLNSGPLSSVIYLTADRTRPLHQWTERLVYGHIEYVELHRLEKQTVYYLRLATQNQFGQSPLSPVVVFRTPDENGGGGGMFHLSKDYYSPLEITEPLLLPTVYKMDDLGSVDEAVTGETNSPPLASGLVDHRWIILGGVLGGVLVMVLFLVIVVLLCRLRQPVNLFTANVKRPSVPENHYVPGQPGYSDSVPRRKQSIGGVYSPGSEACSCSPNGDYQTKCLLGTNEPRMSPVMMTSCIQHQQKPQPHQHLHSQPVHGEWMPRLGNICGVAQSPSSSGHIPSPQGHCSQCQGDAAGKSAICLTGSPHLWTSNASRMEHQAGDEMEPFGPHELHGFNQTHAFVPTRLVRQYSDNRMTAVVQSVNGQSIVKDGIACNSLQPANLNSREVPDFKFLNSSTNDVLPSGVNLQPIRMISRPLTGPRGYPVSSTSLHDDIDAGTIVSSSPSSVEKASSLGIGVVPPAVSQSPPGHNNYNSIHWRRFPQQQAALPVPQAHQQQSFQAGSGQGVPHNNRRDAPLPSMDEIQKQFGSKLMPNVDHFKGFGFPICPNAMRQPATGSDYASQPSSLSNQSSASSGIGMHYPSPLEHNLAVSTVGENNNNNTNTNTKVGGEEHLAEVSLSFALDRVPTPEPTPRPFAFSRLHQNVDSQTDLSGEEQGSKRLVHEILHQMSSPVVFKRKSSMRKQGLRECTPESVDSVSERGYMNGYSAEELSQEMANLEGLMKDLNRITQDQFDSQ